MGPKKGRRVRKIRVPTETRTEFEFRDAAADIQRRREENEREEAMTVEMTLSAEEGVAKKLRWVTLKWTQRLGEERAHLYHNPDTRTGI